MKMDYKPTRCQEVIDAAIAGLIEGGMPKIETRKFYPLFEKIYTAGFNEANRLGQFKTLDDVQLETPEYSGPLFFTG